MNGRAGSRPCTHNAPLFSAREVSLPWLEKENVCDLLGVGNIGLLMMVCSNVRINKEFPISVSHLMQLFEIPLKHEVSIKGLQGGGFLCATGCYWFFSREIWLGVTGHCRCRTFLIASWKRLMKGAWT